jgi:hypothetical protein
MLYNTDSSFAGIDILKQTHWHQITKFEEWAARNDWERFHYSHYDWWVFPIDQPSAFGFKWVVYSGDIAALKSDAEFMNSYIRGVTLVSASWGWDLDTGALIPDPRHGQSWHNWPIRLYKAAQSVRLFGLDACFRSLKTYASYLMTQGESFEYNGKDLSDLFK